MPQSGIPVRGWARSAGGRREADEVRRRSAHSQSHAAGWQRRNCPQCTRRRPKSSGFWVSNQPRLQTRRLTLVVGQIEGRRAELALTLASTDLNLEPGLLYFRLPCAVRDRQLRWGNLPIFLPGTKLSEIVTVASIRKRSSNHVCKRSYDPTQQRSTPPAIWLVFR